MTSRNTEPGATHDAAGTPQRLLSAAAVRDSAQRMLRLALAGDLGDWTLDLARLDAAADYVAQVIRGRYPTLDIPVHSRWRHLTVDGRDWWAGLVATGAWSTAASAARAAFDLVIISVLLDAGAGSAWTFRDRATGTVATRSEGLALASMRWFESGELSERPQEPLRIDATMLCRVDAEALRRALQVDDANPLPGLEGRATLLNRLGAVLQARPDLFACEDSPRPGGLFDALAARARPAQSPAAGVPATGVPATAILETLLEALGPIWQDRPSLDGVPLGDCWPHPAFTGRQPTDRYVPLHKLSQWLAYSLIEPLEAAGLRVTDLQELTGLAEYRNGGLFVDLGVLVPRDVGALGRTHAVGSPFVVAWRSLTVALLDLLAPRVGARLGLRGEQFPLARLLEGGTWAAGRLVARQVRSDGGPPFNVLSDGTVF